MKHYHAPRALLCGMLERDGKVLFLTKKDAHGIERIEMPWIFGTLAADPVSAIAEAFKKQTDIRVSTEELVMESKEDIGEEGKPDIVPVLVFRMKAERQEEPRPAADFSGFVWLGMPEAGKRPPGKHALWLSGEKISVG